MEELGLESTWNHGPDLHAVLPLEFQGRGPVRGLGSVLDDGMEV